MKHIFTILQSKMKKLFTWISNIFNKTFDIVEEKAPLAVSITQKVKEAIENHDGSIQWVLDQTNLEQDNKAYDFIKEKLPNVIKEIAVIDGLINERTDPEQAVKVYMNHVASKVKESRAKEWIFLSAKILQAILVKKLPVDLLILATQKAYHLIFKKG